MSWRAWAASIGLHSAIVALLLGFATVNPAPERTARWEVQVAFTAPPESPPVLPEPTTIPAPPISVPQPPVQAPPPVAAKPQPAPALSTQRPKPPPIAATKLLPQPKPLPRPIAEKSLPVPRKPSPPTAAVVKAPPRPSKQQGMSAFSDAPSRSKPQQAPFDSPRTAFKETRATKFGPRSDVHSLTEPRPTPTPGLPVKPDPRPATADWNAALRARLREMRVYPPLARRLGQEGTVTLFIEISTYGDLRGLTVRQSSGYPVLDQAAQQLARNAVAALRGQLSPPGESRLEIPIAYRLDR